MNPIKFPTWIENKYRRPGTEKRLVSELCFGDVVETARYMLDGKFVREYSQVFSIRNLGKGTVGINFLNHRDKELKWKGLSYFKHYQNSEVIVKIGNRN